MRLRARMDRRWLPMRFALQPLLRTANRGATGSSAHDHPSPTEAARCQSRRPKSERGGTIELSTRTPCIPDLTPWPPRGAT